MQKGTYQMPFDFVSFGTQNQLAYYKLVMWPQLRKIDKNSTIKTKYYPKRNFYRRSRPEVFCKIRVLKNLAKFLGKDT